MEHQPKTNWYTDYLINETINEQVKSIIGTYARLKFNNPNHFDLVKWEADKDKWVDFKHNLPSLFLNTEQEAETLISKISNTNKQLLELELYLFAQIELYNLLFSKEAITDNQELAEIERLKTVIINYNDKYVQLPNPEPLEAIKFRMEQMNLTQKDIAHLFGGENNTLEVFNGKPLTIEMAVNLNKHLGIPIQSLINDPPLD